jgi:hypothetical protein
MHEKFVHPQNSTLAPTFYRFDEPRSGSHCSAGRMGIDVAKYGSRFEALEPIRQGVRTVFGRYAAAVAAGLALRHDHGSQ